MSISESVYEIVVQEFSKNGNFHLPFVPSEIKSKPIKETDKPTRVPSRTLFKQSKDYRRAKKWGERFGTVISCQKVDVSYYLAKIEHLNVIVKPASIELDIGEEFVLNKTMEIKYPKKDIGRIDIGVIDKDNNV
jgi:hypothetical protein